MPSKIAVYISLIFDIMCFLTSVALFATVSRLFSIPGALYSIALCVAVYGPEKASPVLSKLATASLCMVLIASIFM